MGIVGPRDYTGGVTLKTRVSPNERAVLERCSGFDPFDGSLTPENLISRLSTAGALTATLGEQTPFAFRDASGDVRLVARDKDELLRELVNGVWSAADDFCPIVPDSVPIRIADQIAFCTDGPNPRLMIYEPESPTTKLRPLSFKGPGDYALGAKPVVTASAFAGIKLFDCDTAPDWSPATADYTVSTSGDATTLTLNSSTTAGVAGFTKSLGAGVSLTGKVYLVLDIRIQNDPQLYFDVRNLFINDLGLQASGYEIALYSDTECTQEIVSLHIPRATGVARIALALGENDGDIARGVAIKTASYYQAPPEGTSWSITVYSEDFTNDWSHKGNFLMPAIKWNSSPWAKALSEMLTADAGGVPVGIPFSNRVSNGGLETGTGTSADDWTQNAQAYRRTNVSMSGIASMECYGDGEFTSDAFAAIAGTDITIGFHNSVTYRKVRRRVTITAYKAGGAVAGAQSWPSVSTWDIIDPGDWEKWEKVYTVPADATTAKITIRAARYPDLRWGHYYVDDIYAHHSNQTTAGTAVVLQVRSEGDVSISDPADPRVQWAYCFAGRDLLRTELWKMMVSNPSDPSASGTLTFADPWRTYTVVATAANGPIITVAAAPTAGGTGYEVDDLLRVDGGENGMVRVTSVNAGVVTGVELVASGYGYQTGAGQATSNVTDETATGCTINITAIDTPMSEYGDYMTHAFFYRQIFNGKTGQWSEWDYIGPVGIDAAMSFDDTGIEPIYTMDGVDIPKVMEVTNDYLGSAKYLAYSDGRVYAGCLGWDNETGTWWRKTAIAVSNQATSSKSAYAFATNYDDSYSVITDGLELDGYAQSGSEIRGLTSRNEDRLVFLDNEYFLLRGDNPVTGWQFTKLDSIGLDSARTFADCRVAGIGKYGDSLYAYGHGGASPISLGMIDCDLIDLMEPHNAIHFQNKYIFYCEYDGEPALIIYDLVNQAWRIRFSDALALVGLCATGDAVYGLKADGNAVDVFGSAVAGGADYGASSTLREIWTQFMVAANPGFDAQSTQLLVQVETDVEITLDWEVHCHGTTRQSIPGSLDIDPRRTRYAIPVGMLGDAYRVKLAYEGETPPSAIHFLGVETADNEAI